MKNLTELKELTLKPGNKSSMEGLDALKNLEKLHIESSNGEIIKNKICRWYEVERVKYWNFYWFNNRVRNLKHIKFLKMRGAYPTITFSKQWKFRRNRHFY